MSWKGVYRRPCSYSNIFLFYFSCFSCPRVSVAVRLPQPHVPISSCRLHTLIRHSSHTSSVVPAVGKERKPAKNKVHEAAHKQESAAALCPRLQKLSESYWRDTWHRLSSGPFPGRCCCYACASYRSSGTVCTSLPEGMKSTVAARSVQQKK